MTRFKVGRQRLFGFVGQLRFQPLRTWRAVTLVAILVGLSGCGQDTTATPGSPGNRDPSLRSARHGLDIEEGVPLDGVDGSLVVEVAPDGACVYLTPADGRTRYLLAFPQSAVLSSTGGALRLEVGSRETTFVDGERGSVGGMEVAVRDISDAPFPIDLGGCEAEQVWIWV